MDVPSQKYKQIRFSLAIHCSLGWILCGLYTAKRSIFKRTASSFFHHIFFSMIKIEVMKNKKPFVTILRNLIEISWLKIPAGYHLYLYQLWFFFNEHHYLSLLVTAAKSEGEAAHFHSRCCVCWMHILNLTSKYIEYWSIQSILCVLVCRQFFSALCIDV